MKFSRASKIARLKNYPRDILRDENHLYGIILVHIVHKIQQNAYRWPDIKFFKNRQNLLPHSLTTVASLKPKRKQRTATILRHSNKLTSGMCLLGFRRVCALCALSFLLSSIGLLVFFFIHRNHIEALIFRISTFFKQHNRRHKII